MAEFKAHTDRGTVLQPSQAALVADPDGRISLLLPEMEGDATPSTAIQILVAAAMRSEDPQWVEEMVHYLHERKQQG